MMKIIESPREGMQGFSRLIPTEEKIGYINHLLRVGFDTVETGSIVSPKAIPQMADSLETLQKLDFTGNHSNIMALAVNRRGAEIISDLEMATHISYPFSFSPAFMKMNLNSTVEQSLETVKYIVNLCELSGKTAVIYISMAFGNPYGDEWSIELLTDWTGKLFQAGARIIPLSNVSIEIDASLISKVYSTLIPMYPDVEFGLHLHTTNEGWFEKVDAAWNAGCRRFDSVINGWGGCPMAGKEALGNLKTENLLEFAEIKRINVNIAQTAFWEACNMASRVFYKYRDAMHCVSLEQ
ncbi:MAG: hydroxymethylglutaryl-CoA lyase [Bacteroidetes bacterium]|nr:hydroxymethylglutaryl-CoA lyase [Bacteroidota bacterium]